MSKVGQYVKRRKPPVRPLNIHSYIVAWILIVLVCFCLVKGWGRG